MIDSRHTPIPSLQNGEGCRAGTYIIRKFARQCVLMLTVFVMALHAGEAGDPVFGDDRIFDLRFTFAQPAFLDSLYKSQQVREYIPARLAVGGQIYNRVGVRFKGTSSFYGYPGKKKSLRVKFNKYDKDIAFDGLKKINLNNGWSDPTLLREKLYLDFLDVHNIPAPRANFARVYLNDAYWGLYALVEHVDKVFLTNRFVENDGNLYKAEKRADLSWRGQDQSNYYEYYQLKTNEKENNWRELVHLIDRINNTSRDGFESELEEVLHTRGFIRIWAANNIFMNLDAYVGSANNYYLYHRERDERFEWIIWDVNLTFGSRTGQDTLNLFYNPDRRPLVTRMLETEAYKTMYTETVEELVNRIDPAYFYNRIDSLFAFISADYFADTLKMYTDAEIVENLSSDVGRIPGLKSFISNRKQNVLDQLQILSVNGKEADAGAPKKFRLYQNTPNPFNPATTIRFSLSVSGPATLAIYDISGRRIRTLYDHAPFKAGITHRAVWDGANDQGAPAASGMYFYRLQSRNQSAAKRMLLMR